MYILHQSNTENFVLFKKKKDIPKEMSSCIQITVYLKALFYVSQYFTTLASFT